MADLGSAAGVAGVGAGVGVGAGAGRASNGGARTAGPVPVSSGAATPVGMRTPRQIMNERNAREARRQEDQKQEEQRRMAEERRRSEERRAATVATNTAPARLSASSSQYTPDLSAQQSPYDGHRGARVSDPAQIGEPAHRGAQDVPGGRARGSNVSQQDHQPRPASLQANGTRRPQSTQQPTPRQSIPSATVPAGTRQQQQQPQPQQTHGSSGGQRSGASSFPHAFERWESLSSHWEGLTSYWLHKLESNYEEIKDTVPNATTLNRQITDLSAAGANLFHAVVELQRLRASSERKFQRWFFETREDNERSREVQAQLENQLKLERGAREEMTRDKSEEVRQAQNAAREVEEVRRELMISRDEARRAWEELGRRNQESLETAESLKAGRITLISGVQVVPYFGGPSRTGSGSVPRPVTRDGPQQYYGASGLGPGGGGGPPTGVQVSGDERDYYRQEASPTNTDPFMDSGPPPQLLQTDHMRQSLVAGLYPPQLTSDTPNTTSTAQTALPLGGQRQANSSTGPGRASAEPPIPVSTQEAQRFYQQGGQQRAQQRSAQLSSAAASRQHAANTIHLMPRDDMRSNSSYVATSSDADTEYAIDSAGHIRRDEHGRPIIFRRRQPQPPPRSSDEDDYSTEPEHHREQEREREHEYEQPQVPMPPSAGLSIGAGVGGSGLAPPSSSLPEAPEAPEVPSAPPTSAAAMASFSPTATSGEGGSPAQSTRPDYEGSGYSGWDVMQTRHHHPTRLSDVLEEEEERSSRRTAGD